MKSIAQVPYDKRPFCKFLRKLPSVFLGICFLTTCSDKKASANQKSEIETTTTHKTQAPSQEQHEKVLLCKINGKDWYYTEVQCRKILSTDYKPREKFVLNFKNTDTKAGENITLMYNVNTLELEHVSGAIQAPNDEAGVRAFFGIKGFTDKELAQIKDIGMLTDISREKVSGTASFKIAKNSKGVFTNELDQDVSVTDLKFIDISFEDVSQK
ncbi:MAG: hypothetical protein AB3N14_10065 [Flavobacteriaceae bacterium]